MKRLIKEALSEKRNKIYDYNVLANSVLYSTNRLNVTSVLNLSFGFGKLECFSTYDAPFRVLPKSISTKHFFFANYRVIASFRNET